MRIPARDATRCERCGSRLWCAITIQSWRSVRQCFGCWLVTYRARTVLAVLLMLLAWPAATAQEAVLAWPVVPALDAEPGFRYRYVDVRGEPKGYEEIVRRNPRIARYLQEAAAAQAPVLTETQRLQFQVLFQQREIAQLKFEAATADIARLTIAVNVVPGYTFDLSTLSYRPEPKKESSP